MKKALSLIIMVVSLAVCHAQLGAPKITVRDTFEIVRIDYNKGQLAEQDWPCRILVEDPVMVDIAGYQYKKTSEPFVDMNDFNSGFGYLDSYKYRVSCNGKSTQLVKWVFHGGEYFARFSLDGYDFYVSGPNGKKK